MLWKAPVNGIRNTEHAAPASICCGAFSIAWRAKIRSLSFADGRRGAHERNCISKSFISFIHGSFQACFQFLQAIPIPARGSIRRDFEQLANLLKSVLVPDFQDDDLALFSRQ